MVEEIGQIIRKELTTLCSDNANSILLRSTDKSDLMKFTWDQFLSEVDVHAPSLLKILSMAVHKNQSSRNKYSPVLGMVISILCCFRRRKMNSVQKSFP